MRIEKYVTVMRVSEHRPKDLKDVKTEMERVHKRQKADRR